MVYKGSKVFGNLTRVLILAVALGLALLAPAGASRASASPPTSASGSFVTTSATFNSSRSAGGNTIIDLTAHLTYSGTFNGTSVVRGTLIFHPDGSASFHDRETFTGTVNGVPGTVTFALTGGSNPDGVYYATQAIISGTGDLADLHGVLRQSGTVQPPIGPAGTYTGQIH